MRTPNDSTGTISKTFHIGEYCVHGTLKVYVDHNANIRFSFYDYKTNNLKEQQQFSFVDKFKIQMYLEDHMSAYYADKVMNTFYA
jgi:hypothetical protein